MEEEIPALKIMPFMQHEGSDDLGWQDPQDKYVFLWALDVDDDDNCLRPVGIWNGAAGRGEIGNRIVAVLDD